MTSEAETNVTDLGLHEVDPGGFRRIDMDEVRRRANPLMPDGEHAWVIHVVYGLDDPEQALDDMTLDMDKFIGLTSIHCLACHEEYATANRHHKCPGRPV